MIKFHQSLVLAIVLLLSCTVFSQEAFRGERPFIDLDKIPGDSYIKGKLNIKFKPAAASFLQITPSTNNNVVSFGNAAIDELNQKFAVKNAKKIFETTPEDKQYESRHSAWGFQLWYELELPGDVN